MQFQAPPEDVSEEHFIGMLENLKKIAAKWDKEPYIVFVFVEDETKIGSGWRTTVPIQLFPGKIGIRKSHTGICEIYRASTSSVIAEGYLVGMFLTTKEFPRMSVTL